MKKSPTIYRQNEDDTVYGRKRKIRITTGRMVAIILGLIALMAVLIICGDKGESQKRQENVQIGEKNYEYIYTNKIYIENFKNRVLVYDGYNLRFVNEAGNEELSIKITAENFSMDTQGEYIYLTDIARRTTFIIDETGAVVNQVVSKYLPKRVVAMPGGGFVIHYLTDTLEEGIAIYNRKGESVGEYSYPKVSITMIKPSINRGVIVVGLYRDAGKLTNLIYEYSSKGKLKNTNQIDNMILTDMKIKGNDYIWQDIDQIYITNKSYKSKVKIENNNPYEKMEIFGDKIFTLDEDNGISTINKDYNVERESRFSESINGMVISNGEPFYYSDTRTFYKNDIKELTKPVIKVIPMKNTVVLVSKGELKFERR
ncbi:MAG: hypothetical protein ACRDA4_06900 [Filifactoraceae bacterium]